MNNNTTTSLAMLYAIWQTSHQDLLELIQPFVLYSVGSTTSVGGIINAEKVCKYMESEFGYKNFQPAVINRILARAASSKRNNARKITKRKGSYYLKESLSDIISSFDEKRTESRRQVNEVAKALSSFLNDHYVNNRSNYTPLEAEKHLLSFMETQGGSIVQSIEDLRQIPTKNNEMQYYIGRFILQENEKQSVVMDYISRIVKGYFVTTAIYLQAENVDITKASFSNVMFFLDTRILLGVLGYKSEEENNSTMQMVNSLLKHGAKLSCFSYNRDEVYSILEAYKMSRMRGQLQFNTFTLEYFDQYATSISSVDAAQRLFEHRLSELSIKILTPEEALNCFAVGNGLAGILGDEEIQKNILSIRPSYNLTTLPADLSALNTVSRIRGELYYPYIEKCKAVFVTTNTLLILATKKYLSDISVNVGFPLAITSEDLSVMAWIKDFELNNELPRMRLLENVMASLTPSHELLEAFFDLLNTLNQQGQISEDEVTLLRVDRYAHRELMELTHGEKCNLTEKTIDSIRQKIRAESLSIGNEQGKLQAKQEYEEEQKRKHQKQKSEVLKRAENEVENDYRRKEERWRKGLKALSIMLSLIFIAGTIVAFSIESNWGIVVLLGFLSIVSIIDAYQFFRSNADWVMEKIVMPRLKTKKLQEIDKRKELYLELLNLNDNE